MRPAFLSGLDFSTDGCKTKADVEARRMFLKTASQHQTRAHRFTSDDWRAIRRNRLSTTVYGDFLPP